MTVVAGWKSSRRSDAVAASIVEAVKRNASAINSAADLRTLNVSVKFKNGSATIRAVVVTIEAEHALHESSTP